MLPLNLFAALLQSQMFLQQTNQHYFRLPASFGHQMQSNLLVLTDDIQRAQWLLSLAEFDILHKNPKNWSNKEGDPL